MKYYRQYVRRDVTRRINERDREEAILKMTGKLRSLTVEKEELQRKLNEKRKIIEKTSIQLMQLLESDFRQFKLPFAD